MGILYSERLKGNIFDISDDETLEDLKMEEDEGINPYEESHGDRLNWYSEMTVAAIFGISEDEDLEALKMIDFEEDDGNNSPHVMKS